ncbi:S-layer homology domain-containing protein [Agathobaculum hominis]
MKQRNREEAYASSTRSSPRGKRLLSWLLSIVMLLSLLPGMAIHVHAAYEDGMECPGCGEYHWDENCCGNCGACTRACDDDCYEETHCINDCGACRADGNFACDCGYCYDCARELEPEKHCDYCGEEDDGGICSECGLCSECVTDFEDVHCSVCEECIAGGLRMCNEDHSHPSGLESAHCTGESVVCEKCNGCFFEHEDDYCWDCELCQKCALDNNKHCFECGECSSNETPCEKGSEEAGGNTVCESCCESYGHHCSDCYEHVNFDDYDGVEGWCSDGGHGTHCSSCADLTRCLQCDRCWDCAGLDLCDDCGLCEECCRENTETMRCDHDYCVESSDYEDHLCPDCDECSGDDPCEFCGRCASCAESAHCEHGRCEEDPDYDYEHVCPGCSDCFYSDDLCETCELCAECSEHCEKHDICPDNASEWDAHACPDCGECPGEKALCATCGLCETCAEHCEHRYCKYADDFGDDCDCVPCPHNEKSTYQSNRQGHWKVCSDCGLLVDRAAHTEGTPVLNSAESTADVDVYNLPCETCGYVMANVNSPKGEVPPHVHRYDANGYCQVCGAKSDGKPYIIRQPADFECSVQGDSGAVIKARYSLRAYGSGELSYQWYYANGNKIVDVIPDGPGEFTISGTKTPNLVMTVPEDACTGGYGPYYCVVTNAKGSVRSADAHLTAKHNYRNCNPINRLDKDGNPITIVLHYANGSIDYGIPLSDVHITCCVGCSAEKPGAKREDHVFSSWVIKQEPSDKYSGIKSRTCKTCGHIDYGTFTAHECVYAVKFDESGHWEECKTCGAKKPLRDPDLEWGTPTYKESHRFANFKRTVEPTEDAFGEETAQCEKADCHATITREIKKTPHEHVFYTWDEYIDIATEDKGIWDIKEDAAGNLISACMYTMVDGQKIKVFGADVTYHWYYCKKPSCNEKGVPKAHKMTGWIVDFPPDAATSGSSKSECRTCGYEVRKAMEAGSYPIVVENGISLNAEGKTVASGRAGDVITIRPRQLSGKVFSHWKLHYGGVTLTDPNQEGTTFTVKKITPAATHPTYADYIIHLEAVYDTCQHDGGRVTGEVIPAGCTSYGKAGDTLCAVCGAVLEEGGKTEPNGHAPESEWVIDPSSVESGDCRHYGNSGNLVCPDCGETMKPGEKTPRMHAHTTLTDEMPATCTTRGFTGNLVCDDCSKIAERGSFINKSEHSFGEWKLLGKGGTKEIRECTACGLKETRSVPGTEVKSVTLDQNTLTLPVGKSETLTATVLPEAATNKAVMWTSADRSIAAVDENGKVTAVKAGKTTITVTTVDGSHKAHCDVTVTTDTETKVLAGIQITTPPKKTTYVAGESFDKTGMTVYAVYTDNTRDIAAGYTYSPSGALKTTDTEITVSYTAGSVTVQTTQKIKVVSSSAHTGDSGSGDTTYGITVKSAKNGDVTASHKSASKGTTVTLTVDPDKGYVLDTLTVLDGKDKELKLTEKNGKYTFTMPASKVTVEAMFKAEQSTGKNSFTDVPAGSYYEDAVIWAVDKGITTGTSATTFDPNGICTRAQAVTFLWRAAGSPAAKSSAMPFADVQAGSYYYDAVLWAVENGITKGTSDTMFSPDATCTRAQIVTFLWRANGSPAVSGDSAFTDMASDAYYAAAVTWAEKNDVTGGIGGGLFGSNNDCTRAQIVTFLYRSVK